MTHLLLTQKIKIEINENDALIAYYAVILLALHTILPCSARHAIRPHLPCHASSKQRDLQQVQMGE